MFLKAFKPLQETFLGSADGSLSFAVTTAGPGISNSKVTIMNSISRSFKTEPPLLYRKLFSITQSASHPSSRLILMFTRGKYKNAASGVLNESSRARRYVIL